MSFHLAFFHTDVSLSILSHRRFTQHSFTQMLPRQSTCHTGVSSPILLSHRCRASLIAPLEPSPPPNLPIAIRRADQYPVIPYSPPPLLHSNHRQARDFERLLRGRRNVLLLVDNNSSLSPVPPPPSNDHHGRGRGGIVALRVVPRATGVDHGHLLSWRPHCSSCKTTHDSTSHESSQRRAAVMVMMTRHTDIHGYIRR